MSMSKSPLQLASAQGHSPGACCSRSARGPATAAATRVAPASSLPGRGRMAAACDRDRCRYCQEETASALASARPAAARASSSRVVHKEPERNVSLHRVENGALRERGCVATAALVVQIVRSAARSLRRRVLKDEQQGLTEGTHSSCRDPYVQRTAKTYGLAWSRSAPPCKTC